MNGLKPVGTIKTAQPRSIGKLYQPPRQTAPSQPAPTPPPTDPTPLARTPTPRRGDSVGKIYTAKRSCSREPVNPAVAIQKSIIGRTTRDEMQDKLVEQIFSGRTSQKGRYNYLAQPFQPIAKNIIKNGVRLQEQGLREKDANRQIEGKAEPEEKSGKLTGAAREGETVVKNGENKAGGNENKQNCSAVAVMKKREVKSSLGVISRREQTGKEDLGARVKEMIMHYETKNREHSLELQKLQLPTKDSLISTRTQSSAKEGEDSQQSSLKAASLQERMDTLLSKLVESNLKSVCLAPSCDEKLQQLWRSVHHQLILDEKLRIFRYFINEENKDAVVALINENRIKKIDPSVFQIHTEEYDPFLIEKISEMTTDSKISTKEGEYLDWVADNFMKSYDECEKNWLKYFSQETMSSTINTYELAREPTHPKAPSSTQQPTIRDYTRLLSTLFKSNLRNRNIYQMHSKLKGMAYAGRFLQLLWQKSGESTEAKKLASSNK